MKKLACLLVLLGIAGGVLASCQRPAAELEAQQVIASFSAQAQVTQQESVIGCSVARTTAGVAAITITSPQQLSGMSFEWNGPDSGISYQGLSLRTQQPFLPETSFAAAIINVLTVASVPENLTRQGEQDGFARFSGDSSSGHFTILANGANGFIQEIQIEALELRAVFTDQKT